MKVSCKSSFWSELITRTVLADKQSILCTSRKAFKLFILPWTDFWDKVGTLVVADPVFAVFPSRSPEWSHEAETIGGLDQLGDLNQQIVAWTFYKPLPAFILLTAIFWPIYEGCWNQIQLRVRYLHQLPYHGRVHPNNVLSETNAYVQTAQPFKLNIHLIFVN